MTTPIWKIFAITATGGVGVAGVVLLANAGVFGTPVGRAPAPIDPAPAQELARAPEGQSDPEALEEIAEPAAEVPQPILPAFDVVRIEPDGTSVIAGIAAPGSIVALMLGDDELSRAEADGSGRFAAFLTLEPSDAPRTLSLVSDPDGAGLRSDETVIVSPFAAPQTQIAAAEVPGPGAEAGTDIAAPEEPAAEVPGPGAEAAPDLAAAEEPAAEAQPAELADAPGPAAEAAPDLAATEEPAAGETPEAVAALETDPEQADPGVDSANVRLEANLGPAEDFGTQPLPDDAATDAPAESGASAPPDEVAEVELEPEAGALQEPEAAEPDVQLAAEAEAEPPQDAPLVVSEAPALPTAPDMDAGTTPAPTASTDPERAGPSLEVALADTDGGDLGTATAPGDPVSAAVAAPSVIEPSVTPGDIATLSDPGAVPPADDSVALLAPQAPENGPSPDPASAPAPEPSGVPAGLPEVGSGTSAPQPSAPSVFVADSEGVRILQPAGGETAPDVMSNVALDSITYDEGGDVIVGGRGSAESFVRIYLNNEPVTVSRIAEDGQWRTGLPDVDTGVYTLRVDEVSAEGEVISRIETPFRRESPEILARVMAEETSRAGFNVAVKTVQPGHTLWAIAEERYGDGVLYVRVFEANRDLIRDPNMIFPGQVFRLPEDEDGQEG